MTNREKYFLKLNEYDLILLLKDNLNAWLELASTGRAICVLDLITGEENPCPDIKVCETCEQCIQRWLNRESE